MPFNNFSFKKSQYRITNIPKTAVDYSSMISNENIRTHPASTEDYSEIMPLKRPKEVGELYDEGL